MSSEWDLSASLEDYLEVILDLVDESSVARVKDIAERLDVKRSSVTIALRTLSEKGYVNYAPYSVITLTNDGFSIANCIRRRHKVLKELFIELFDIDVAVANKAACDMEHGLKSSIYRKMAALWDTLKEDKELFDNLKAGIEKRSGDVCNSLNCCAKNSNDLPLLIDLTTCRVGDAGMVRKVIGETAQKKRYTDMGISIGQPLKIVSALTDGVMEVQVKSYRLSLKSCDGENIFIEREEEK